MTELEIIIKDLRKDMAPEDTSELDERKANFFKNLDAKYPGIYNAYLEMIKEESESEPEPKTDNIEEIIDDFLEFLDNMLADDEDEELEDETSDVEDEANDCDDCGDCDLCDRYDEEDAVKEPLDFERIEFHDPATIVFWNDGTKTVVKARHGDKFDKEKGLAMAIAKKVMGNTNKYYDVFEEFCFDEEDEPIQNVLEKFGITPDETDAGNEETFDLEGNSTNEAETVAKPVKEEKPKKGFGLKRGKKQD